MDIALLSESESDTERSWEIRKSLPRSKKRFLLVALAITAIIVIIVRVVPYTHSLTRPFSNNPWQASNFKSLIAFGDSYTDERRYDYFSHHNWTAPPTGTFFDESNKTQIGGRTWPRYVVQYTGNHTDAGWTPSMTLYNYAVGGSFCTREVVALDWPTLLEYAVPAFVADLKSTRIGTDDPYFQPPISASDTVAAVWIGANDLGHASFLHDRQVSGKTLTSFTQCVFNALDGIYASGVRTFVLMSTAPLHLAPTFANSSLHGEGEGDKNRRGEKMREITTSVNSILRYQTPYEVSVSKRFRDAHFAFFDVWSLMREIYVNPDQHFNGSLPANVTSYVDYDEETSQSPDSFFWKDGLHPSEQTSRIVARNFVDVLNGVSEYADYW